MRPQSIPILAGAASALLFAPVGRAQVTLVEPGHVLIQHMDTIANPAQMILEQTTPGCDIESICVDRANGDVYFQLIFPPGAPSSMTSHIWRLTPATGALVPIAINTGFAIAENGTDMQIDVQRNLLVTQHQGAPPLVPPQIASVGMAPPFPIGTWAFLAPPLGIPGTFGMDFSNGNGAGMPSVVPPGDIVFMGDGSWDGIHHVFFAAPAQITHVPPPMPPVVVNPPQPPVGPGDDLVNQPDGDWIWIGDVNRPILQILPFPPFVATNSGLVLSAIFGAAPVPNPFTYGTRAAVCDITGDFYVTCSGATGGSAIFRIDERLTTATLVLTVGTPGNPMTQGIHDLELGPASFGLGNSVYFTVHDYVTGGEQVWEVSAIACCPTPASTVVVPDGFGANVPMSIAAFPPGNLPKLGNATFAVQLDDPGVACALAPGITSTFIVIAAAPASVFPIGGFGCVPGGAGELMVGPFVASPTVVPWGGPGVGAVHPLPIPFVTSLCGAPVWVQGLFLDPARVPSVFALSWRLDLILGS